MEALRPTFFLFLVRHTNKLASVLLDDAFATHAARPVQELDCVGFRLEHPEPDMEYCVRIGDLDPTRGLGRGRFLGEAVVWERDAEYFESARGRAHVTLWSRHSGEESDWRQRGQLDVDVVPSKVSEQRYQKMLEDLRGLAAGLVFDLVSKATLPVAAGSNYTAASVSARSSQLELRLLESKWPAINAALEQIAHCPVLRLRVQHETRAFWGSERLGPRAIADLARAGLGRGTGDEFPLAVRSERLAESHETIEHGIIVFWLQLLAARVRECQEDAKRHIRAIEAGRSWRDAAAADELSLFDIVDRPRLRALNDAVARCDRLDAQIRSALTYPFLRGVRRKSATPRTPTFDNVLPYRRLRREVMRYLDSSSVTIADGTDERTKPTSRMYEQWVFLQLAAAFRAAGLRANSSVGFLQPAGTRRFSVDLERDSRVTFTGPEGRAVILRYEPEILPQSAAQSRGDSLYRGRTDRSRTGARYWSPDLVIEFQRGLPKHPVVEDVIVVDAKYTKTINDEKWDKTTKYFEIRSCHDNRQIVRQLWLAYPGADALRLVDDAVDWTPDGPNCPRSERVRGVLGLRPGEHAHVEEDEETNGWLAPADVALEFARGLLRYLGFIPSTRTIIG